MSRREAPGHKLPFNAASNLFRQIVSADIGGPERERERERENEKKCDRKREKKKKKADDKLGVYVLLGNFISFYAGRRYFLFCQYKIKLEKREKRPRHT